MFLDTEAHRLSAIANRDDVATFEGYHPPFSLPYGSVTQLYQRGYVPEFEDFARCVRTGEPSTISYQRSAVSYQPAAIDQQPSVGSQQQLA